MSLFEKLKTRPQKGYRLQHHDPFKRSVLMLAAVAALGAGGWYLYDMGFTRGDTQQARSEQEIAFLTERIAFLEDKNQALTKQVALLERSSQIEQQAAGDVKGALDEMEAELLELKEELSFYRSIVSPSKMDPGLHVQALELERGETRGEYLYKLVLTQVRGSNRVARGVVDLKVQGTQDGASKTLRLKDMSPQSENSIKFSFKYFQSVEGSLLLPVSFQPESISIDVKPNSRRLKPIHETHQWDAALVGENT